MHDEDIGRAVRAPGAEPAQRCSARRSSFDTEQEGLLLLPGDRFAVQHSMPRWGQVGIVDEVEAGAGPPPEPDTTTLLLHADGTDGSTTIIDSSLNAATMTVAGAAQIDTAQSVFGGASLRFGSSSDYVETPAHARYDLGAIDAATSATWRFRARWNASYAFANVKLLVHGTSRPFVDVSSATKPVANMAAKCRLTSGKITFFDTSAGLIVRGSDSDWQFGTGAWFVSGRISAGTYASGGRIFDTRPVAGAATGWALSVQATTRIPFVTIENTNYGLGTPAANLLATSSAECTISASYDGTSLRLFVDGALSWTHAVGLNIDSGTFLCIANTINSNTPGIDGNASATLRDLVIVKGEAVATAAFTVPAAWPDSGNAIAQWNPATYANVKLNCHMAGANGGTTFTDTSASARTITRNGNAQTSTAQARIGSSSGLFDGTGDYLTAPDSADWDFGTGEFYVQMQIRPANITVRQMLIANYLNSTTGFVSQINLTSNGRWNVNLTGDGSEFDSNVVTGGSYLPIVAAAWQELGFGRVSLGGTTFLAIFYEGEIVFLLPDSQSMSGSTFALYIGRLTTVVTTNDFNGHMQEVRVVKGECPARSYSVQTAPHPDS